NKTQSTEWMMVSAETTAVVKEAIRLSRMTDGAFDVTVAPLVNLWGFGSSLTPQDVPTHEAIREALQTVGYQRIHVQDSPSALRKEDPAVQIDLSAIAKGYAVDQVAEYLDSVNMAHYLVEIGGELRSKGYKAQDIAWKVAIEKPVTGGRTVFGSLRFKIMPWPLLGTIEISLKDRENVFPIPSIPKPGDPLPTIWHR
ncbi:MAG: FAD:protein FMN transferase, partial [Nitrospirota bacterium]|nr:FAD:protein FMN transferase [Nitrospirota bacterium]